MIQNNNLTFKFNNQISRIFNKIKKSPKFHALTIVAKYIGINGIKFSNLMQNDQNFYNIIC